jgi:hypothetical protein
MPSAQHGGGDGRPGASGFGGACWHTPSQQHPGACPAHPQGGVWHVWQPAHSGAAGPACGAALSAPSGQLSSVAIVAIASPILIAYSPGKAKLANVFVVSAPPIDCDFGGGFWFYTAVGGGYRLPKPNRVIRLSVEVPKATKPNNRSNGRVYLVSKASNLM